MERIIAGNTIEVNEEGYMTNFSQWNKEIGDALAQEANIVLTPRHWEVVNYLQDEFKKEVAFKGDPAGQVLSAMLVGQCLNTLPQPIYRCV